MIPPLLLLPATTLDGDDVDDLAALVASLSVSFTVLVGAQRTAEGPLLDEFVVASALAARDVGPLGVSARVGAGRAASVIAREATAAQLLGGCHVLLLEGDAARCRDAATVICALLGGGPHWVSTPTERVEGARNHPLPDADGALTPHWCEGASLLDAREGVPAVCGTVRRVAATEGVPEPEPGTLVVLTHEAVRPAALATVLAR